MCQGQDPSDWRPARLTRLRPAEPHGRAGRPRAARGGGARPRLAARGPRRPEPLRRRFAEPLRRDDQGCSGRSTWTGRASPIGATAPAGGARASTGRGAGGPPGTEHGGHQLTDHLRRRQQRVERFGRAAGGGPRSQGTGQRGDAQRGDRGRATCVSRETSGGVPRRRQAVSGGLLLGGGVRCCGVRWSGAARGRRSSSTSASALGVHAAVRWTDTRTERCPEPSAHLDPLDLLTGRREASSDGRTLHRTPVGALLSTGRRGALACRGTVRLDWPRPCSTTKVMA